MKRGSLRLRLFGAGAVSVALALAVAALGLMWLFERHVERRVALELQSDLRQLVGGLVRAPDGSLQISRQPAEPRFQEPLSGRYWQIGEPDGPLLRSRSLWDDTLDISPDALRASELHQHILPGPAGASLLVVERSVGLPGSPGGGKVRVAVAVDRAEITAAARVFGADLLPALGVLALVLTAAAWLQVTVGLRPLDAVRRRLGEVRAGQVARLGAQFPDEVRPLAAEVDHLLEAQEQAIARARTRAADLAHGLKTPLTVLAAIAEELREAGEGAVAQELGGIADGMRRHVERELARARAGLPGRRAPAAEVAPVIARVLGVLRRTPRGQELDWQVVVPDGLAVAVEAEDLAEMLGNLVENAVKWARGAVRVSAAAGGAGVRLLVADDGPGIAEAEMATALLRGGRLDETRPGTGLGLAIVSDLAEAYGATLTLGRAEAGGLAAELLLPGRQG